MYIFQQLIGAFFTGCDPADSLADGCVCDFGGGIPAPNKVVGGVGCEAGLSRLVTANGVREYSLEKAIVDEHSVPF